MKILKRKCAFTFLLVLALGLLAGYRYWASLPSTTLTLRLTARDHSRFLEAVARKFPEIELQVEYYTGPNTTGYLSQGLAHQDASDLFYTTTLHDEALQREQLLDLSGQEFVRRLDKAFLDQCAADGALYLIPGPWSVRIITYNKTLFEENGWQRPENHAELMALIRQIRTTTELIPFTFSGAGLGYHFTLMSTLAQCDYLGSPAGTLWEKDFQQGKAAAAQGFGSGARLLQDWIDAGAFSESCLDNWEEETIEDLMERRAAMGFIAAKQPLFSELAAASSDEFDVIPFYGEQENSQLLSSETRGYFGLSKRLSEPGNEKKLAAALKIMDFLTSEEGQATLKMGDTDLMPLKGSSEIPPLYESIHHLAQYGHVAPFLYEGYTEIITPVSEAIRDAMFYGGSMEAALTTADTIMSEWRKHSDMTIAGSVREDMTRAQTAQLFAEILYQADECDLALISIGDRRDGVINREGVNGRLYAGEISMSEYPIVLPGQSARTLCKLRLTGAEIFTLLEQGKPVSQNQSTAYFDYFWAGIDVAKNQSGTIASVRMADGSLMEAAREYTVLGLQNDFAAEVFENADPVLLELDIASVYLEYLKENSPLSCPSQQ